MTEQNVALAPVDDAPVARGTLTPMDMVQHAVTSGAGIEVVEKLLGLQERWEAGQARKAFDSAVALAKGEIPSIVRDRQVGFESRRTGENTSYRHESLDQIATIVNPILNRHGLSYRFKAGQDNGRISVTCVLSHRDGYSEETTLAAGADDSGKKNSIQAIGSTTTYLQRYTLKLALGLSTTDRDDDGAQADAPVLSGAAEAAINSIQKCESLEALRVWREQNDATVQELDPTDRDAVTGAWSQQSRQLRTGASQ